MGCRQSKKEKLEETEEGGGQAAEGATSEKLIVVFGATGLQGGSVARALHAAEGYKVRAVTRNPDGDKAKTLAEAGVEVVQADLDDTESLKKAVDGAYGVFGVTPAGFTEEARDKEIQRGKNIVDVSKECGVKHLIYSGLDDVQEAIGKRCTVFDSKTAVEKHLKEQDMPFTIVYLPFYHEILVRQTSEGLPPFIMKVEDNYVLAFAVGDSDLYVMCVEDVGICIKNILGDLDEYKGKTLPLAAEKIKSAEMASIMAKHLEEKVVASGMSPEDLAKREDIESAAELAVMMEFCCHEKCFRDIDLTRKLNPDIITFETWVENNKDEIRKVMEKQDKA